MGNLVLSKTMRLRKGKEKAKLTHRQVEHTGTGWQKTEEEQLMKMRKTMIRRLLDRQTEQTKPMSTIFL